VPSQLGGCSAYLRGGGTEHSRLQADWPLGAWSVGETSPSHSKSIPHPSSGRSQFSTAKIAFNVTNNLYPGYGKRTLGACADTGPNRQRTLGIRPNKVAPTAACNSLYYKTLPITPLAARLCRAQQGYLGRNSCICNIYGDSPKKSSDHIELSYAPVCSHTNQYHHPHDRRIICLHTARLFPFRASAIRFHESV